MSFKDIEFVEYRCTLIPLTPIHIGSGNELSPFEYIVKNGHFYKICTSDIIDKFPEDIKLEFIKILESRNMFKSREFIKNNYKEEYGYEYKTKVSQDFKELYERKIGGAGNKNEENQLGVGEFIGSFNGKFIPGSTIKGALRTAYLSSEFSESHYYQLTRNKILRFQLLDGNRVVKKGDAQKISQLKEANILGLSGKLEPKFDPFKFFRVTDTEICKDMVEIKSVIRKGIKNGKLSPIPMGQKEVTKSLFSSNDELKLNFNISIKNLGKKADNYIAVSKVRDTYIVKETTDFYLDTIFQSLNDKATKMLDEDIKFLEKIYDQKAVDTCKRLQKILRSLDSEREALIRFGQGAGFNSTTFNLVNQKVESIGTRVTVDNLPIGWALITCEEVDK